MITLAFYFIVVIFKLFFGLIISFSILIAVSIKSFIDFITDVTNMIANKIGKEELINLPIWL